MERLATKTVTKSQLIFEKFDLAQLADGYVFFAWRSLTSTVIGAESGQSQAIPAWITIQLDTDKRWYSAYFGTIDALRNPNAVAVPMSLRAVSHYECLAFEKTDPAVTSDLSNQLTEQSQPQPALPVQAPIAGIQSA